MAESTLKHVVAGVLDVAYLDVGPTDGDPVILLHGFPYDVHCFEDVAERLAAAGRRCIVPYLRGYGPTTFIWKATLRSGQQAALGADLLALMDALVIPKAVLAGFDWGGRAASIVAALWPERASGLVSCDAGYNIQDIPDAGRPASPESERRLWYQYYFHSERGRAGLESDRRGFCRYLWTLWSPTWRFDEATFARQAASFDNADFVDVVIHSYRHRYGVVPGDPALDEIERRFAAQPDIVVPTIILEGADDGVTRPNDPEKLARHFTGPYRRSVVPSAGHNVPQEAPAIFADAVLSVG